MSDQSQTETYEQLYARLREVVASLEAGELPLAELLRLYEEGVHLAAACQKVLDEADLRVQQLEPDPNQIAT
jgi:exodeoxyribonuclease VII small subunit